MSPKKEKMDERALIRLYQSSVRTTMVSLVLVLILETMMILLSLVGGDVLYEEYEPVYRGLFVFMWIVALISLLLCRYVQKDIGKRYRILQIGYIVAAVVSFAWVLAITYFDGRMNGMVSTVTFMAFSLAVPLCFYMPIPVYIIIAVIADIAMTFIAFDPDIALGVLPNLLLFFMLQLGLGSSFLRVREKLTMEIIVSEKKSKELEEMSRAQSHFFSNMSHEIRTPINTIIGLNEMILRENASEEINEDAQNINAAGKMLLHLINDILDMSKIESGQMVLNEAPYHTGDMLSDVVGMLWIRAREKNLEFHVDVNPELPAELYGDEVRIRQILINVLNNAIKYTDEGSVSLSVGCERDGKGNVLVSYSVKDTGIGIKRENIPYLFTAFKRVDEDRNKYIEGTGLGLSIVKQMVDMMHGSVTVNSIYTKGSTFVVEIPQRIVSDEPVGEFKTDKGHRRTEAGIRRESFKAPAAKVLVVDDTPSNLLVTGKLLKETEMQVDTASSGEEALKKTLSEAYHIILMDHKMPGMDGIECLHAIRSQTGGLCHGSSIIALTANAGSNMESLYIKEGFDGYLIKPVTGDELERTVVRFLPEELVTAGGEAKNLAEESTAWLGSHRKKRHIKVTTESVADLPKSILDKYNIAVLPHMVQTDHGLFKDGLEINTRGLLPLMEKGSETVLTKAPTLEDHERFFARQLDEANNIIHVSISGKVNQSGYIMAKRAADSFGNVNVVDSEHLSSGQGLVAIEAARLVSEGLPVEEILARLEKMKGHVHSSFIVDSLDFLARQKQVSNRIATMAAAMMVHPVISLENGKMSVSRIYFGSRERAWEKYISSAFRVPGVIDRRILFITYVGMTEREIDSVRLMAEDEMQFDEVFYQEASPAVAANSGPGTFGLLFFTKY